MDLTIRKKAQPSASFLRLCLKNETLWVRRDTGPLDLAPGFPKSEKWAKILVTEVKTRRKTDVLSTDRETDYKQHWAGVCGKNPNETKNAAAAADISRRLGRKQGVEMFCHVCCCSSLLCCTF